MSDRLLTVVEQLGRPSAFHVSFIVKQPIRRIRVGRHVHILEFIAAGESA